MSPPTMKIEGIMARSAPVVVLFCRKPHKWTRMVRWNTADDTFERGQWIRGRLLTRSADVSPDGSKLIYHLTRYRKVPRRENLTVISTPPYFTAIACWSLNYPCCGGGLFRSNDEVELHDPPERVRLIQGERPATMQVMSALPAQQDWATVPEQQDRNGWTVVKKAVERQEVIYHDMRALLGRYATGDSGKESIAALLARFPDPERVPSVQTIETLEPEIRRKTGVPFHIDIQIGWHPKRYRRHVEQRTLYFGDHQLPLRDATWADIDQSGRAVFARGGIVYVIDAGPTGAPIERPLADFSQDRFEEMIAPEWATKW